MNIEAEWCSWCFQKTTHKREVSTSRLSRLSAPIYRCNGCGNLTRRCVSCSKMACASPHINHRLCATHRGEITAFEAQGRLIADPADYKSLFKNSADTTSSDTDIKRAVKKTAFAAGAAAGTVLLAATVRKVTGGNVGRFLGHSGKVADNAGLAFIGSGSIADGGGGIQAGTQRTYYALGKGALHRVRKVNKAYFGDQRDEFKVRLVRAGTDPALICINGFHNEETDEKTSQVKDKEWLDGLGAAYPGHAIYRVVWPSKTEQITKMQLGKAAVTTTGSIALARLSMRANKLNGSLPVAGPLAAGALVSAAADFSWLTSLSAARRTSYLLAELISRCDNRSFVLIGHSLGARICVLTLRRLAKRAIRHSRIIDVHLMGGAIDRGDADYWLPIAKLIEGRCVNYYSDHDDVLKLLFPFFSAKPLTKAIGRHPLPVNAETQQRLTSINVSDIVKEHQQYHSNIHRILHVNA